MGGASASTLIIYGNLTPMSYPFTISSFKRHFTPQQREDEGANEAEEKPKRGDQDDRPEPHRDVFDQGPSLASQKPPLYL